MYIALLSSDVMLASIVHGSARRYGATVNMTSVSEHPLAGRQDAEPCLVIVDLRLQGVDLTGIVDEAHRQTPAAFVLACGPHVHETSLARAASAGFDEVATRGEFQRRLDVVLEQIASRAV